MLVFVLALDWTVNKVERRILAWRPSASVGEEMV
jgi:hypothetical protein